METFWDMSEFFVQGVLGNLVHWMTWPVVIVAGLLFAWVRQWWIPLLSGVLVATLTEVYFVTAIRAAFAPTGFVGPRDLGVADLLPGFVIGAVLTVAVQRLVILFRKFAPRIVVGWETK